jgi:CxxC motif-containing protein (DUF1111 family)
VKPRRGAGAITLLALSTLLAGVGCEPTREPAVSGEPGAPLPGLSAAELERFREGRALFTHQFTPQEGLGPLFNEDRCSSCHDLPTVGGTGVENELKATRFVAPDSCDLLIAKGGDVFEARSTPALRRRGIERGTVPPEATGRARVIPPELYGLGLVEAIPEAVIRARADQEDRNGDGIKGHPGRSADGRLARFGQKADQPTIRDFVESALLGEMGLTTPGHPAEKRPNGRPLPPGVDPAPDPEVSATQVARLADFVRFLAPPAPTAASPPGQDSVRRGERLFQRIGCASCHVPEMWTGPSAVSALDQKTVALYSDLLLHDLGPRLGDICAPGARPPELRTARLSGLRLRTQYLHDGRAPTIEEAILQHGGEASSARDAFTRASPTERRLVLRFLSSL